jgi:azurin
MITTMRLAGSFTDARWMASLGAACLFCLAFAGPCAMESFATVEGLDHRHGSGQFPGKDRENSANPAESGPSGEVTPPAHPHPAPKRPWDVGRSVFAKPDEILEIKTTGVALTYDITEIRARAGQTLTIRYDNSESEMAHNIVVVRSEKDIMPVGTAALRAHRNEFIPKDQMDRIVAFSKLAFPGDAVEFSFVVPPPGIYPFICTYSGHFTMMQGRLISLAPEDDTKKQP